MIRQPPISIRTDTRLPYPTRVRPPAEQECPPPRVLRPARRRRSRASDRISGALGEVQRNAALRCQGGTGRGGSLSHGGRHLFSSEEHTSELQSLMRISYAVFCLKNTTNTPISHNPTPAHEHN